jgi:hypothetical protein
MVLLFQDVTRWKILKIVKDLEKGQKGNSQETATPGNPSKPEMVVWSELLSIRVLFEYLFGQRWRSRTQMISI